VTPLLLAACAATPMGPTVQVLPGPNKPFDVFQQDQFACKQYAQSQVAGQADAANQRAVETAALGTILGVGLGAAVGGHQGAGLGAGAGAIIGSSAGATNSAYGQGSIQYQYDNAYTQCMYAKGNQVPGAALVTAPPAPAMPVAGPAMTVQQAQERLNAMGFDVGHPDGVMGPRTREQLVLFQKSRGIAETGELDAATVAEFSR
jgi:uncharacterized protein YcfJ